MDITARNFWFEGKRWFEDLVGLSGDEAHLHIGLALFVITFVLFHRWRYRIVIAWAVPFLLELANETLDARDWITWTGGINTRETINDFIVTLFWPTVLAFILWKFCRSARIHPPEPR